MRFIVQILTPMALLLALLAPASTATAAPAEVQRKAGVAEEINTCRGETVQLEGTRTLITKEQSDGTFRQRLIFQGEGTGDQGNEYLLNFQEELVTDGFDFVLESRQVLVSKGSAPNQESIFYLDSATGETNIEAVCTG